MTARFPLVGGALIGCVLCLFGLSGCSEETVPGTALPDLGEAAGEDVAESGCQSAAECDDGNVCNGSEQCAPDGACVPGQALACDDGDPCNGEETCDPADGCGAGATLVCDDGNACNGQETCTAAGCLPGDAPQCDDQDACNGVETCDESTGCVAGDALTCNDNDACNGLETCDPESGCAAGAPLECDDGDACNGAETCDAASGCQAGVAPDCDDDDACNGVETCDSLDGCVAGSSPVCDDNDACNGVETCDESIGCVAGAPLSCNDGLPCNGIESCEAGAGCVQGTPPDGCCTAGADCDDGNLCNGVESCDAASNTCVFGDALSCDDQDACNGLETCDPTGGCVAGDALECDDSNACNGPETCDAVEGCVAAVALECDDSNACNGQEICLPSEGCKPGSALVCDDGDVCNGLESCNAQTGCVAGPALECDDGDLCNGLELCDPTVGCGNGDALVCDDQDACNGVESCVAEIGCVNGAPPTCDDGLPCNGVETCDATKGCVGGTPPEGCCTSDAQCDDKTVCNGLEYCSPDSNTCIVGDPLVCDDGLACNGLETCDADTGCQPGAPLECDDGAICNGQETCDQALGCVPGAKPQCDDGDACNGQEVCDVTLGCIGTAALVCNDGNFCNGVETCDPATGCQTAPPPACNDNTVCNGVETCHPAKGCLAGVGLSCDDGDPCNGEEQCDAVQGCTAGSPLDCDDQNACNGVESCFPKSGCVAGAALQCDDGNACNGLETCGAADGCVAGSPLLCDDGNACTADVCDFVLNPKGGCHYPVITAQPAIIIDGIADGGIVAGPVTLTFVLDGVPSLGMAATLDGESFASGGTVEGEGQHALVVTVTTCKGSPIEVTRAFSIDTVGPTLEAVLTPKPNAAGWNNTPVTVTWVATDATGTIVSLSPPETISSPGASVEVQGQATDSAGHVTEATVTLNLDFKAPALTLETPKPNNPGDDQLVTSDTLVVVSGEMFDDALSGFAGGLVTSSKTKTSVTFENFGEYEAALELLPGINTIVVSARDVAGNTGTASICVIVDQDKPTVFIQFPPAGYKTTQSAIDVSGVANDLVVGSVTSEDLTVTVNGVAADIDNSQFVALNVPLVPGSNTLVVTATDSVGLTATDSVDVLRLDTSVKHLEVVSGNNQKASIGTPLAEPLVVRLLDANGVGIADHDVAIGVTDNDGTLENPEAKVASPKKRSVLVTTNADGHAMAFLTVGSRAGVGVNRVTASADGALSSVSLFASSLADTALNLHPHAGLNQVGTVGEPLPMPLSVVVTDEGGNPVSGQAVTWTIEAGDGKLAGGNSTTVLSNGNGFADIVFTPGPLVGHSVHAVRASMPVPQDGSSGTQNGVQFRASAFEAADPTLTRLRGRVLDENEAPVAGVRIHFPVLGDNGIDAWTDANGRFEYQGAPPGFALIEVDATGATPAGANYTFPHLTFELHNVPGIINDMDRPIFLLRLNAGTFVNGLETVEIGLDELPGFVLTIPGGTQLTFPDGSNAGTISITQVHFDQAPMAPIDGLQSRVLVTIQPPGVKFDPPAPLQVPNVDNYPPAKKVEMFSFDHDLEQFVSIGTGSVSEDGTVIRTDPGVGVVKGGWHCGSNPQGSGGSANVTASAGLGGTGAGNIQVNASGGPGEGTVWSFAPECGNIAVSGGPCADSGSCQGQVSGTGGDIIRGRVKVTHTCTETGDSADDTVDVNICDISSADNEINISGYPDIQKWVGLAQTLIQGAAVPMKAIGCGNITPKFELGGNVHARKVCCPGCDGVTAWEGEGNLSAAGSLAAKCAVPGLSVPFLSSFGVYIGLVGEVKVQSSLSGGVVSTGCCANPPCWCAQVENAFSLTGSLKAQLGAGSDEDYVADVSGGVQVGIGSTARANCKKACFGACFQGLQLVGTISFLNGAVGKTWRHYLVCPGPIAGKCFNLPAPSWLPGGGDGQCAGQTDVCGNPTSPPGEDPNEPDVVPPPCTAAPQGGPGSDASITECNDNDGCTSNSDCSNQDPCDGEEVCNGGTCGNGPPLVCDDGLVCTKDSCEKFVGCTTESACEDDSVACTVTECFEPSGCVQTPQDSQCDDGVACTQNQCNTATGCQYPPQDSQCEDGIECTEGVCDAATGCAQQAQDTVCSDGIACTADSCDTGSGCVNAPEDASCDDGLECTSDSCSAAEGCVFSPNDAACSDGVDCTKDTCSDSAGCQNQPEDAACADGIGCTLDTCNAQSGCSNAPDSSDCDDGNVCNGQETCSASGCAPGTSLNCNDGQVCNGVETCQPAQGCVSGSAPPGCCTSHSQCQDGDPCNGDESCVNTVCQSGVGPVCDDGDACNGQESCAHGVGCVSGAAPSCDDGNPCNGVEICGAGGCQSTAPPTCDDGDACNGVESCNPGTGCVSGAKLTCNDGDPCNGVETCAAGSGCQSGPAPVCDDSNPCNGVETCAAGFGCAPGTAPACDDGNACNGVEICSAESGCTAGEAPVCDDQDTCNGVETCDVNFGCLSGAPTVCDDGDPSTTDGCDPIEGCQFEPVLGSGKACAGCDCGTCGRTFCVAGVVTTRGQNLDGECVDQALAGCDGSTDIGVVCAGENALATFSCANGACVPEVTACPDGQTCRQSPGQNAACGDCCDSGDCPFEGQPYCEQNKPAQSTCDEHVCTQVLGEDCAASGAVCSNGACEVTP